MMNGSSTNDSTSPKTKPGFSVRALVQEFERQQQLTLQASSIMKGRNGFSNSISNEQLSEEKKNRFQINQVLWDDVENDVNFKQNMTDKEKISCLEQEVESLELIFQESVEALNKLNKKYIEAINVQNITYDELEACKLELVNYQKENKQLQQKLSQKSAQDTKSQGLQSNPNLMKDQGSIDQNGKQRPLLSSAHPFHVYKAPLISTDLTHPSSSATKLDHGLKQYLDFLSQDTKEIVNQGSELLSLQNESLSWIRKILDKACEDLVEMDSSVAYLLEHNPKIEFEMKDDSELKEKMAMATTVENAKRNKLAKLVNMNQPDFIFGKPSKRFVMESVPDSEPPDEIEEEEYEEEVDTKLLQEEKLDELDVKPPSLPSVQQSHKTWKDTK